jgi:uncharacterized membrane protein
MNEIYESQDVPLSAGYRRAVSILLWISVSTGWLVSTFSVIQEMCMVSACRDTAGFTIFGINMGWFGIAYFSVILIVMSLRKKDSRMEWLLSAMVFAGIGAELRLLWIQKYVIEGWCPLCVTICCALFCAAILLTVEKLQGKGSGAGSAKKLIGWLGLVVAMFVTGLAIAFVGVKALY